MAVRTWNEILTAAAETIILNDTDAYTNPVSAIYVLQDTVFNTLTDAGGNDHGSPDSGTLHDGHRGRVGRGDEHLRHAHGGIVDRGLRGVLGNHERPLLPRRRR